MMQRPIILVVILVISLLVGIFVGWPRYQAFSQLTKEVALKQAELYNRESYFANLKELDEKITAFPEELAKIEAAIPDDPQLPLLYDFLQNESAASGLTLRSISVTIQESMSVKKPIDIVLDVSGSYPAFKELLLRLRTASRMTTIQSVTLASIPGTSRFNFHLILQAYSY